MRSLSISNLLHTWSSQIFVTPVNLWWSSSKRILQHGSVVHSSRPRVTNYVPTVWTTKFASGDLLPRHIPKSNWKQSKAIKSNQKQSKAIHSNQCSLLNAFNCFWLLSTAFDCFQLLLIAFDCFRSHPQEGGLRTQTWWFRRYLVKNIIRYLRAIKRAASFWQRPGQC